MTSQIIELQRPNKSVSWGFSIQGGKDFGCPLSILRVNKNSIADQNGICLHDLIVSINDQETNSMTHQQAILLIQKLYVKLELKKPSAINEESKTLSEAELPLPPTVEFANNSSSVRISTNIADLPPPPSPPHSHITSNTVLISTPPPPPDMSKVYITPPPPPPLPDTSKVYSTEIKKEEASRNTPSPATSSNLNAFRPYPGRASVPAISLSNQKPLVLNQENENKFQRKISAGNPQVSGVGLGAFLQEHANKPPGTTGASSMSNKQMPTNKSNRPSVPAAAGDAERSICWVCKDRILGAYIEANGKIYCSDHFKCSYCNQTITGSQFIETKEGTLYCVPDYTNHIAPKCNRCNEPVFKHQVMALGKVWHPNCFLCNHCNQPIPHGNFHVREDPTGATKDIKIYCENDYKAFYEIKCFSCKFPIEGDEKFVKAAGNSYHVECYKR